MSKREQKPVTDPAKFLRVSVECYHLPVSGIDENVDQLVARGELRVDALARLRKPDIIIDPETLVESLYWPLVRVARSKGVTYRKPKEQA